MGRMAQVSLAAVGLVMPGPVRALQAGVLVGPGECPNPDRRARATTDHRPYAENQAAFCVLRARCMSVWVQLGLSTTVLGFNSGEAIDDREYPQVKDSNRCPEGDLNPHAR